jgi:hypothetical protein
MKKCMCGAEMIEVPCQPISTVGGSHSKFYYVCPNCGKKE